MRSELEMVLSDRLRDDTIQYIYHCYPPSRLGFKSIGTGYSTDTETGIAINACTALVNNININNDNDDNTVGRVLGVYSTTDGTSHPVTIAAPATKMFTFSDQKSLIEASIVNKYWDTICHSPAKEQHLVPYCRLTSHAHKHT